MRGLFSLILIAALAYGGVYIYYGFAMEKAIDDRLVDFGLSGLEVDGVRYGPLAPISTETTVTATLAYGGSQASVTIRVDGHPLFGDDMQLEPDGLRALQLLIGPGD